MIFRIAALKAKSGVTSAQALHQAGAMDGYLPPYFSSKLSNWRAASAAVGAS
ncbi:MAG: hypothetical protein WAO78_13020 [Roseovarius sp.]